MKFGETLYQRSVPKWSAYNVKYNELKDLIKSRTSSGTAVPVSIPSVGVSRWQPLENDLFRVISAEYENVALFLHSKQGEIERRLSHLEKQVHSAKRAVEHGALDRPILQARKYQKLLRDADGIGDEIENLSRFANVQKTAIRKILKKYRKWTGSTALQHRLDVEVFSSGALQVDYAEYLGRLSAQSTTISSDLAGPMLAGHDVSRRGSVAKTAIHNATSRSRSKMLNEHSAKGSLDHDAALATVPYSEVAGSAYFWIHPDNLEQAETLILRHMRTVGPQSSASRTPTSVENASDSDVRQNHLAFFDNAQRFGQDRSISKPSRAALTARWTPATEALITLTSLTPKSAESETLKVKRKDLASTLKREPASKLGFRQSAAAKIRDYLSEHRDVKPLAELHSSRSRYIGINNSNEVGTWATLDSSITIATCDEQQLGDVNADAESGEAFPHAIFFVRWEFSRVPELVRILDASHLAERLDDFSTEEAAVYTICKDLKQPEWVEHLSHDIRRVPPVMPRKPSTTNPRIRTSPLPSMPESTGPSSTDGPTDSVFSAGLGNSSATSVAESPGVSQRESSPTGALKAISPLREKAKKKRKRARIVAPPSPEPRPQRYWNEFDDGESDTNVDEGYAIYVNPDESSFPGAETVSRAFGAMCSSLSKGKGRIVSWLPLTKADAAPPNERTPLIFSTRSQPSSTDADLESSESESDDYFTRSRTQKRRSASSSSNRWFAWQKYRPHQPLTRRQKALEATLFQFYGGLLAVSYVLLIMAAILLSTGRRKKVLEVDAGVVAGVMVAEACATASIVLLCMRRQRLSVLHYGLVAINITTIIVLGIAELTLMFAGRAR